MRIAILGAECTGKTLLAQSLVAQLRADFPAVAMQADPLKEWREVHGRPPLIHEQHALAHAHMERIQNYTKDSVLLCDTTPLMAAVHCDVVFGDGSLYPWALEQHQTFALTLLMGMDLPWNANGTARHDQATRTRVDQRLRDVLIENRIAFSTVYGQGAERDEQARVAILSACGNAPETPPSHWKWSCEKCSDADCEHRMFTALLAPKV